MRTGSKKGFTLIETVIYIALFTLIITGTLASTYSIVSSSARNQTKAMIQEEGSFLVGKIDWVLTGIQSATVGGGGSTLSVIKFDTSIGNPLVLDQTGGNLSLTRGTNPPQVLNNSNITLTCPVTGCFVHTAASGDGINPESVSAFLTLHAITSEGLPYSQDFSTVKYLRK